MRAAQHRKFDDGVNLDVAPLLLPEGYLYSSMNMLYDKIGIVRKRGGVSGVGATTTYDGDHLGVLTKDDGSSQLYSYGRYGSNIAAINSATGAFTSLAFPLAIQNDLLPDGGRPFQHYGFLIWPSYLSTFGSQAQGVTAVAGSAGAKAAFHLATPNTTLITAGNRLVSTAASNVTNAEVGMILSLGWDVVPKYYIGRIMRIVDATHFEVYPTPTLSSSGVAQDGYVFTAYNNEQLVDVGSSLPVSGKVGMSFQGRVLLGSVAIINSPFSQVEIHPRRVVFSSTLIEQDAAGMPEKGSGAVFLSYNGFPAANYFDIPSQEEITAMSPTGFGDALIFSAFRAFRVTGNLTTQFGTTQSITWAVREIPNSVGCMSERSLQRSPRGLIFAHDSGVYSTDGQSMQPLMYRRIGNEWRRLVAGAGFKIYGSALIRGNHYYICGVSAGVFWAWMLNLDTMAWGPITGKASAPASWLINSAITDPANPAVTWGLKWWNEAGSVPSMTGGQLVRLDQPFNPSSSNRADSDGTQVGFSAITRPYTEDSPTLQKNFLGATIEYKNKGGAAVSVTPFFGIDPGTIPAGGQGTPTALPKQDVYTVTAGTNAAPIVLTVGAGHTITQGSWVRVIGVLGLTKANGLWRVGTVTGTTLTLLGSVGNAAYTSGGTIQLVDSKDITLLNAVTNLGANPAGVIYRINDTDLAGAAGADEFELMSILHTWEDRDVHSE